MRSRTLITILILAGVLLAATVPACKSGGPGVKPKPQGGDGEQFFPDSTVVGEKLYGGQIEVMSIKTPEGKGDTGEFQIRNIVGKDLEYLTGTILFFCDREKPGIEKIDSEGTLQGFDIFEQQTLTLKAVYKMGLPLQRMMLLVEQRPTEPGVTFLGGKVECVEVVDNLPTDNPRIAITVRNTTNTALESVKYRVVLLSRSTKEIVDRSQWVPVSGDTFGPGETKELVPEFRDEISGYPIAVLLIKQLG